MTTRPICPTCGQKTQTVLLRDRPKSKDTLSNPKAVCKACRALVYAEKEHFVALHLDARHRIKSTETISIGTATASLVHPREVFRAAIRLGTVALILCHNHPSGDPEPSPDDREITGRLRQAGELLGIKVLDHVILGRDGRGVRYYSFREEGW